MDQIKRLEEGTRAFDAGGRRYIVHEGLTVDGFQMLEELRVEIESGNSAGELLKHCQKTYSLLNAQKFADASVTLYNAINIAERINAGKSPAWLLALTLFIRPEGSDVRAWDEAEAEAWIKDWAEEGFSVADLFTLAIACHSRFDSGFLRSFQDISAEPSESAAVQSEGEKTRETP